MLVTFLLASKLRVNDTIITIPASTEVLPDVQIPLVIRGRELYVGDAFVMVAANLSDAVHDVLIAVVLC